MCGCSSGNYVLCINNVSSDVVANGVMDDELNESVTIDSVRHQRCLYSFTSPSLGPSNRTSRDANQPSDDESLIFVSRAPNGRRNKKNETFCEPVCPVFGDDRPFSMFRFLTPVFFTKRSRK